ncbi:MAG: lipopolysaccharide biosynthesis protein [Sedimentisphaerales bacterium]|nr:lipopolysaccharide biosynthesis protein [Sedimentisphaerales bacterium]
MSESPITPQQSFPPDRTLYKRTVRSGLWVFALRGFTQLLSFARYIILANILDITDIGLLGIAMLMMQMLGTFSQTGFQAALIQKKDNVHSYLDTAWTIGLLRAVVLYAVLYWAASFAELSVFKVPPEKVFLVISIIRVLGISFFLAALGNIGIVYFRKDLKFNRQFFLQITATLTDVTVTIFVVLVYKTVWALVIGKLAGDSVRFLLSYVFHPYRPRIRVDFDKARELWRFGKWVFGGSIIEFLTRQGDDFFVWGYLGVPALALYQMAYKFSSIPSTEITSVMSAVTFPAYAKLQDNLSRLKDAYLKILQQTTFLTALVSGLIFVMAGDFVRLFLKETWLPIIPALQILTVFGFIVSMGATRGPVFHAVGQPKIGLKIRALRLALMAITIYPLSKQWGISGTALSITLPTIATQPLGLYMIARIIRCSIRDILRQVILPIGAALVMMFVVSMLNHFVIRQTTFLFFFLSGLIGVCVYMLTIYVCDKIFGLRIIMNIREQISAIRK